MADAPAPYAPSTTAAYADAIDDAEEIQFEPTTPPEELSRGSPNSVTCLWRITQIGEDEDRFEQAKIVLESSDLDLTGVEVVADEVRDRYNEHGELRGKLAKAQDRIEELEEIIHEQNEQTGELRRANDRLEAEVERLQEAISKSKAELDNVGQAGRPTAAAYNLLKDALAAEDGSDE